MHGPPLPPAQFVSHITTDAKCREARELRAMLPKPCIVDAAFKTLHALSAPFIPTSSIGNVAKGTWHGVDFEIHAGDGSDPAKMQLPIVKPRAAECVQVIINFMQLGPNSEAAALFRSAGPRVRELMLQICAEMGDVLPPRAFGLDETSGASSEGEGSYSSTLPAFMSASAQNARVCMACGSSGPLKRCGGCQEAYFCGPSCQVAAWPRHKEQCKVVGAARRGQLPSSAGAMMQ